MAGGTDLLVKLKQGRIRPRCIIDIKGIREFDGLENSERELTIGALTPLRTIETSAKVLQYTPLLAQGAALIGSVQVRHRATIGGNLCNASPAADTAPPLLALDAQAVLADTKGPRTVGLEKFFKGPGKTLLGEDALLTHLKIPLRQNRTGSAYNKLCVRGAMDLAFVGVAVLLELNGSDRITRARIALGAVASMPVRAGKAEQILEDAAFSVEAARESTEAAVLSCEPITDLRATVAYRRAMVKELCFKGIHSAYRQAVRMKEGQSR